MYLKNEKFGEKMNAIFDELAHSLGKDWNITYPEKKTSVDRISMQI